MLAVAAVAAATPANASTTSPSVPIVKGGGSIGVRLVDVPTAALADPRARICIVDHLAPGTVITRRIAVTNTTAAAVPVSLYGGAATIANGEFVGGAGQAGNELSSWIAVDPGTSAVPPGGVLSATVTISVPAGTSPGERYGVIWAETRAAPTSSGVTEVSRVGIRVYLSVGAGGPPAAELAITSLSAQRLPDGQPVVVARVRNTGGRALDVSGTLQLSSGPGGLSAGPFPATLGVTLAIGDTEPVTIALAKQIPAGPWRATVILHSGSLVRTAQATITFPVAGTIAPASVSPPPQKRALPTTAGIIVLVSGAAAVFGTRTWWRTSRRRPRFG
jgi:hypothetical protein